MTTSDSTLVLLESLDSRTLAVEAEVGALSRHIEPAVAALSANMSVVLDTLECLRNEIRACRADVEKVDDRLAPMEAAAARTRRVKRAAIRAAIAAAGAAAAAGIVAWARWLFGVYSGLPPPPH